MLQEKLQDTPEVRDQEDEVRFASDQADHLTGHRQQTPSLATLNSLDNETADLDSNSGRLPENQALSPTHSSLMSSQNLEESVSNRGSLGSQLVSPNSKDLQITEVRDESPCLMSRRYPLLNPLYPLSPESTNVEHSFSDTGLPDMFAEDGMTFEFFDGHNSFPAEDLFSLPPASQFSFNHISLDPGTNQGLDYLPDFDISSNWWEMSTISRNADGQQQQRRNNSIHESSQNSTRMAEVQNSSGSSRNSDHKLPRLINDIPPKPRPIYLDEQKRSELVTDLERRMLSQHDFEGDIPDCSTLQSFLTRFFDSFNTHLPIFHIPTFDLSRNPSPLVLAMCSIGAMYQLERKRACRLRRLAHIALDRSDALRQSKEPGTARPTWMVQCKLLLLYGSILGGDAAAASLALEEIGYLPKEFKSRKASLLLDCETSGVLTLSWQEWIDRESSKRLLFGIFILISLLTITYNMSPGLSTGCDLDLELPEEEHLWTAPTAESWKDALLSTSSHHRLNASHLLTQLLFGKGLDTVTETRLGLYAAVVLVHAVNIHVWHASQSTNSFTSFFTDAELERQVARDYLKQIEVVLTRYTQVFAVSRCIEDGPPEPSESPLPFNGLNLLRSCYARVICDGGGFTRAVLLTDNEIETDLATKRFVQRSQYDMPLLTKIVAFMVDCLRWPSHLGRLVIRKTAALTWSVETVIVLWDCALYTTKWTQIILGRHGQYKLSPLEQRIVDGIRQFTSVSQEEKGSRSSMAAILADTLAAHFDDVWVWQVTSQMGKILRKLADAYDEKYLQESTI